MASAKVFSLEGKGLKLDSAADVEAHIKPLREMKDVEEVKFLGNTLGVEACKVIGEILETKKSLQVWDITSWLCEKALWLIYGTPDSKSRRYIYWPLA
jgi:Ran GTPase-activating protein (RanGAP) involved in mRNA processing and transport